MDISYKCCFIASPERGHTNREYLDGALSMARCTALSCGLRWQAVLQDARAELGGDVGALLDQTRQLDV